MLDHNLHGVGDASNIPAIRSELTKKGNGLSSNKTASNEVPVIFLKQINVSEACELTRNLIANYEGRCPFPHV